MMTSSIDKILTGSRADDIQGFVFMGQWSPSFLVTESAMSEASYPGLIVENSSDYKQGTSLTKGGYQSWLL